MTKESSRLGRRASGRAGGNLQQITELARLTRSSKSSRGIYFLCISSFLFSLSLFNHFFHVARIFFSFLFSEKERGALTRPDRFLINRFFVITQPDIFPTRSSIINHLRITDDFVRRSVVFSFRRALDSFPSLVAGIEANMTPGGGSPSTRQHDL